MTAADLKLFYVEHTRELEGRERKFTVQRFYVIARSTDEAIGEAQRTDFYADYYKRGAWHAEAVEAPSAVAGTIHRSKASVVAFASQRAARRSGA